MGTMRPTFEEIKKISSNISQDLVREHLARLDDRYYQSFSIKEVVKQIEALSKLSKEDPAKFIFSLSPNGTIECTVLAFDHVSVFSMIAGVLSATGFSIRSCAVFTYSNKTPIRTKSVVRNRRKKREPDPLRRKRIIDHFSGRLTDPTKPFEKWKNDFKEKMNRVFLILERKEDRSIAYARHLVNQMVADHLEQLSIDPDPVLYPVSIELENQSSPTTQMRVVSRYTPAYIYALSNALAAHHVTIERVSTNSTDSTVENHIEFIGIDGRKITDEPTLRHIKLSVLLTKQFTYFLGKAPDPYAALERFERLVLDIGQLPEQEKWLGLLSNPAVLRDLAKLLGTSDFFWEDFVRLQYESLIPTLEPIAKGKGVIAPIETVRERLDQSLKDCNSYNEAVDILNQFKDREIFLIDLDHMLGPTSDFRVFAERLSLLAETIVDKAAMLSYQELVESFGRPTTPEGKETRYAIMGLGKIGGAGLGYASDIELLFVYEGEGRTDGANSIRCSEFFEKFVKQTCLAIRAKREGIFNIDLRLRPNGESGPLACSLDNFSRYYDRDGPSHSFERLALVRLRAIGGISELGALVEAIRDEKLYASDQFNLEEVAELRRKQITAKVKYGERNAKFSPGALVDLEYQVQILQITYGSEFPKLRTPRIHKALIALSEVGVLDKEYSDQLSTSYSFFRRLINGLRMLRGSARDLLLPEIDSDEFTHLARRIGYKHRSGMDPARQLRLDFDTHTAAIRAFVKWDFGKDLSIVRMISNAADLVLTSDIPDLLRNSILYGYGFKNPERAYRNLRSLGADSPQKHLFAKLSVLLCDILRTLPDPDRALSNWERFVTMQHSSKDNFHMLFYQPDRLELLLGIFSNSQVLADTLIRNPPFMDWVTIPENLQRTKSREEIEAELQVLFSFRSTEEWFDDLRRFRRREMLRIGARDMCLGISTSEIMYELSNLAEAIVHQALNRIWLRLKIDSGLLWGVDDPAEHLCIMALGKLGGQEINYSSDIDLLILCDQLPSNLYDDHGTSIKEDIFATVVKELLSALSVHTERGYAYRVDLRLRPYGSIGRLVNSVSQLVDYYQNKSSLWEVQALLKARPVAGNIQVGYQFLERIRPLLLKRFERKQVIGSIDNMRQNIMKLSLSSNKAAKNVKIGVGGIRDAEFLVQGLQLIYATEKPFLLCGNTLKAIRLLEESQILPKDTADQLALDYIFLRKTEHYLQVLDDRQTHSIPQDSDELQALAKRMLGVESNADEFITVLDQCLDRVRTAFVAHLLNR